MLRITLEGNYLSALFRHANLYVRYEGIPGYQDGQLF